MNTTTLVNIQYQKIGKEPVVIVPLKQWEDLEDRLEDFEMSSSLTFRKKIAKARAEKKRYTSDEAKKMLGI
jgi:hypothetical protein